ncbi:MAG TPA: tRNA preQ1(34) S-adenosylmethionine ribosyltransferase-isomerase QueA [Tepidisphaeraceae bacterium]|jgi:S-adenosylmethionine:tRNA ribosyltransferase-isomerase|nr:tRNA preQ1(34) S-adenosylmethionine ribosyltransferase-isomerase QueA [Tepidisphaeraceae bacterium]
MMPPRNIAGSVLLRFEIPAWNRLIILQHLSPYQTMRTDELDFDLPTELIAQEPPAQRSLSRLLHYRKADRSITHRTFPDLPRLLRAGDLLVFNDARVIPARLALRKDTGGRVSGLFLAEESPTTWRVLLKNVGRGIGTRLFFPDDPAISISVLEKLNDGEYRVAVDPPAPALTLLERLGRMPLPPYIRRDSEHDARDDLDRQRYQTVFASAPGAVAAPTAALHFTPELLAELDARGIRRALVTLHVGMGTFKPVTTEALADHAMHVERYSVSKAAADALNHAKADGRRIVAVGTTSARVIESQPGNEPFVEKSGETEIFIYPPYMWKHVGALVTNFHLPRSTLIALVAAMVGLEEQRRIYRTAIAERYRFFSYGDAMFIE